MLIKIINENTAFVVAEQYPVAIEQAHEFFDVLAIVAHSKPDTPRLAHIHAIFKTDRVYGWRDAVNQQLKIPELPERSFLPAVLTNSFFVIFLASCKSFHDNPAGVVNRKISFYF